MVFNVINEGMEKSKIVVSLQSFANTFNLSNSTNNKPGSAVLGPGETGELGDPSTLTYSEVRKHVTDIS